MYGLDPDNTAPFTHICGSAVQQVGFGTFDLQLHFHPKGHVSIWRRCEVRSAAGESIGTWRENGGPESSAAFVGLLGAVVAAVVIPDASTLHIRFTDGRQLVLFDESLQHESFSVDGVIV